MRLRRRVATGLLTGALLAGAACGGPGGPPPPTTAERINAEGLVRLDRGEMDSAEELFRDALQEAELVDDLKSQAEAWNNRGALAFARGHCDDALHFHTAALRVHALRGVHDAGELRTQLNLGIAFLACGRKAEAKRAFGEATTLAKSLEKDKGAQADIQKARLGTAMIALDEGKPQEALAEADIVAKKAKDLEDAALGSMAAAVAGAAYERSGDGANARKRFEDALALDRQRQAPVAVAADLSALARIAEKAGDLGAAASFGLRGSRIARRLGDLDGAAAALRRAETLARRGGLAFEAEAIAEERRIVEDAATKPRWPSDAGVDATVPSLRSAAP